MLHNYEETHLNSYINYLVSLLQRIPHIELNNERQKENSEAKR
uniref:Uncharacterized protein n=1 Tax=Parascaris equorum TaxID=6256 RepID=A0A914R6T1_PAREQ